MARFLPYAKDVAARRRNGQRIGLLVVAVRDWEAGKWFEGRPEVARLVLPEDVPVAAADWSLAIGLDCLVCGDGAADPVFYGVCTALQKAGAASIWGDFSAGVLLMEQLAGGSWVTETGDPYDGPYSPRQLAAALREYRTVRMMRREGFYGSRIFDGARRAVLQSMREVRA